MTTVRKNAFTHSHLLQPCLLPSCCHCALLGYSCAASKLPLFPLWLLGLIHREVLVKFASVSEHATRVHTAWAAAGLAPELIDSQQLPCGLTMHVMEYLSRDDGWTMFYSLEPEHKQQLSAIILDKLQEAHAVDVGGGARAVHADMRQGNVMIQLREDGDNDQQQLAEPQQVRFLDFDWSGLEGQARLPAFMRQRIGGYGSGQQVSQQYDRDLWSHELETGGE